MRIPFDIKYRPQIESGEYKVETRDGNPVRIICWDKDGSHPIVALVTTYSDFNESFSEHIFQYGIDGYYIARFESDYDLFIVTMEEKMTEFEKCLGFAMGFSLNDMEENRNGVIKHIKDAAKGLLALAEKEITKGHEHDVYVPEDTYHEQLKKQWEEGYDKGKSEALKDLPRWKKIGNGNNYSSETKFVINGRYLEMNDTLNYVYEVPLYGLKKLPKED